MLRVITGTAKGTHLKVPTTGLRPATDLVRGAIFSMLENLTGDWSQVLDVFSGSGAFGIEGAFTVVGAVSLAALVLTGLWRLRGGMRPAAAE